MKLNATEFMVSDHLVLSDEMTIKEIFEELMKKNLSGCILVNKEKEFSGNFNQRDILLSGISFNEILNKKAANFKSFLLGCQTVEENSGIGKILEGIARSQYGIIFVLNQNKYPVGLIQSKNILQKLISFEIERKITAKELSQYNTLINDSVKKLSTIEEDYLRFKDLFNNSPDMIHSVDQNGRIIQVNTKECEVLGYSEEELLKMNVNKIYASDIIAKMIHGFEKLKRDGQMFAIETAIMTKDGLRIDVEVNSTAVYDEKNQFVATRSILRDITARKELEVLLSQSMKVLESSNKQLLAELDDISRIKKELENSNHALEKNNMLKDDLVAMVSHDLKSPISTIIGVSQLALDDVAILNDETKNLFQITYRQGNIALSLCNSLLDNYKIERGAFQLNLENIPLSKIVESSVEDMAFLAEQNSIEFKIQNSVKDIWVYCDPLRVSQVLKNLLSNALKWSPKNGSIEIQVEESQTENIAIISVSDHGPGLDQDRITEIFNKAEQLKRKNPGGTGFGLSIAKKVIEMHGGTLKAISNPKVKTTFIFTLPNVTKKEALN